MRRARRRIISVVAVSALLHGAVLALLALHAPELRAPDEDAGPPLAVIPVLLLPRTPPPAPGAAAPSPIRLHRRPQRVAAETPPIAPLRVPRGALEARPPAPAPPSPLPPPPLTREVRTALRLGPVGCANAEAVNLTKAEREKCDEQLAAGAKDAPWYPPGKTAARRAELQAEGARKDALVRRKEAPLGAGIQKPFVEAADYDGEPYQTGAGVSAVGQATHPPSRRAAKKLGRLKP